MSKIQINGIGGGIFSKFITSVQVVEEITKESTIPEIYYNTLVHGVSVFDYVLDQSRVNVTTICNSVYLRGYSGYEPIELSKEFLNLKQVFEENTSSSKPKSDVTDNKLKLVS